MAEEPNQFGRIFTHYAKRLRDAPGAARLVHLAKTAKRVPAPLLDDLAALILQLDDVKLVGDDIALHLIEVAYCDVKYADAVGFASSLRTRLHRYIREPGAAENARAAFKERHAWWRMAVGRSAKLRSWPAVALMETAGSVSKSANR